MKPALLLAGLLLAGCAGGGMASGELPQAPGTVRPGRQARYERPVSDDAARTDEPHDTRPTSRERGQILFWLLAGLAVVGTSTFLAERASRQGRGSREE